MSETMRIVSYGSLYSYYMVQDLVKNARIVHSIAFNNDTNLPDGVGTMFQLLTDQIRKLYHEVMFCCWLQISGYITLGSLAFSPLLCEITSFGGYPLIRRKIFGMWWQQLALYNKINNCQILAFFSVDVLTTLLFTAIIINWRHGILRMEGIQQQ